MSATENVPTLAELRQCLLDEAEPIAKRMRSVFLLKQLNSSESINALAEGLSSPSVLLAHECAYVLGQLQAKSAIPLLLKTLSDTSVDPITRHECGEALAAIGDISALPVLQSFCDDSSVEVAETCQIAVEKLKFAQKSTEEAAPASRYHSVDPAPPLSLEISVDDLFSILTDQSLCLFERYRAMFALRDVGTSYAVEALAGSLSPNEHSAVFRHEIAYVLGQMQHPAALTALQTVLANSREHAMVRHEAAEAIGAIAEEDCADMLKQYETDLIHTGDGDERIVSESCSVALDLIDYWNSDQVSSAIADENESTEQEEVDIRSLRADIQTVKS